MELIPMNCLLYKFWMCIYVYGEHGMLQCNVEKLHTYMYTEKKVYTTDKSASRSYQFDQLIWSEKAKAADFINLPLRFVCIDNELFRGILVSKSNSLFTTDYRFTDQFNNNY